MSQIYFVNSLFFLIRKRLIDSFPGNGRGTATRSRKCRSTAPLAKPPERQEEETPASTKSWRNERRTGTQITNPSGEEKTRMIFKIKRLQ